MRMNLIGCIGLEICQLTMFGTKLEVNNWNCWPSLVPVPYKHNNLAYCVYEMEGVHDNTTFQLIDYNVYFFNLTIAKSAI